VAPDAVGAKKSDKPMLGTVQVIYPNRTIDEDHQESVPTPRGRLGCRIRSAQSRQAAGALYSDQRLQSLPKQCDILMHPS
jgi:hypothetical protein